jgi:PD-(D/E)XK nuclease superfamily
VTKPPLGEARLSEDQKAYIIDGSRFPRITTVNSDDNAEWLERWREKLGVEAAAKFTRDTAELGTLIHKITELSDKKQPTLPLLDNNPWLLPALWEWEAWRDKYIEEIIWAEQTVWSRKHGVAGTLDRLAMVKGDARSAVIDFKSTKSLSKHMGVQLRFYLEAAGEVIDELGLDIPKPTRTIIVHIPGPRPPEGFDVKNIPPVEEWLKGWKVERIKPKEYEHENFRQELEDKVLMWRVMNEGK